MGNLIYGVGVYRDGKYKATNKRKITRCYSVWRSMIQRCYDENYQKKDRSKCYVGCSVSSEWHEFQNFAEWYHNNHPDDGLNYHLDKDLKVKGNRVYSSETCLIVPSHVNAFILDSKAIMGELPIGVHYKKSLGKYISQCKDPIRKKKIHIGVYLDPIEAHMAWRKKKSEFAKELADAQKDDRVRDALINYAHLLENNLIHKI